MALYAACLVRRMPLTWHLMEDDAMITRARAELVASFLKTDATHLLFIDADIGFASEQVFRLLDFGSDFCAAAYPLKDIDWSKIAHAASAEKNRSGNGRDELCSALACQRRQDRNP